jgi:hypothetical protein
MKRWSMLMILFAAACDSEVKDSPELAARKAECWKLEEHLSARNRGSKGSRSPRNASGSTSCAPRCRSKTSRSARRPSRR